MHFACIYITLSTHQGASYLVHLISINFITYKQKIKYLLHFDSPSCEGKDFFCTGPKTFKLTIEEGGQAFTLKISQRRKSFLRSIFIGWENANWLLATLVDITVADQNKDFITKKRGGDKVFMAQRDTNAYR